MARGGSRRGAAYRSSGESDAGCRASPRVGRASQANMHPSASRSPRATMASARARHPSRAARARSCSTPRVEPRGTGSSHSGLCQPWPTSWRTVPTSLAGPNMTSRGFRFPSRSTNTLELAQARLDHPTAVKQVSVTTAWRTGSGTRQRASTTRGRAAESPTSATRSVSHSLSNHGGTGVGAIPPRASSHRRSRARPPRLATSS